MIVGDVPGLAGEVTIALREENIQLETVASDIDARQRLADGFDMVISSDLDGSGGPLSTSEIVTRRYPHTSVLVVTTPDGADRGAEALESGGVEFLVMPASPERTLAVIRRTLRAGRMRGELSTLRQTVAMEHGFDNLVGVSESMTRLKDAAGKLAPTDITVLITGPAGSGKESLARIMHHHSRRRHAAFVAVDFSVLTESLAESVLFGCDETSSQEDQTPLLASAHGGTLFLENIEAVPPSLQKRLAQFLRDYTVVEGYDRVGRKIDVRILAAAVSDPVEMVAEGKYDGELYRLLSEIKLQVPPLSRRVEDIELLAGYFLRRYAGKEGAGAVSISPEAVEKLQNYGWPGQVRELENCLRRAAALGRGEELLPEDISFFGPSGDENILHERRLLTTRRPVGRLAESQRSAIIRALEDNDWNFTQTARELGIGRTTLWRKVKKYQLKRESVATESTETT